METHVPENMNDWKLGPFGYDQEMERCVPHPADIVKLPL